MKVLAPAKSNLFLEVRGRRPDGYHDLDTVFCALELADEVEVAPARGGALELTVEGDASLPATRENLAWRAADALRGAAGRPDLGARLRLLKRIPAGGGLGGGSSDAASVLRALDAAWGTGLRPERLALVAAGLGSDVAFFLRGGLQRGTGRGEVLSALPAPPRELELVLVFPGFACPTPDVYRALAPFLPAEPRTPAALLAALERGDVGGVAAALFNRLEGPALAKFPGLAPVRDDLARRRGVLATLLSGSGSTLVGLVETRADAERVVAELRAAGRSALATRTAARSPAG